MEEKHLKQLQINTVGCSVADTCRYQGRFLISQCKQESINPGVCDLRYFLTITCILGTGFSTRQIRLKVDSGPELLLQRMVYRTYI